MKKKTKELKQILAAISFFILLATIVWVSGSAIYGFYAITGNLMKAGMLVSGVSIILYMGALSFSYLLDKEYLK